MARGFIAQVIKLQVSSAESFSCPEMPSPYLCPLSVVLVMWNASYSLVRYLETVITLLMLMFFWADSRLSLGVNKTKQRDYFPLPYISSHPPSPTQVSPCLKWRRPPVNGHNLESLGKSVSTRNCLYWVSLCRHSCLDTVLIALTEGGKLAVVLWLTPFSRSGLWTV